MPPKFIRRNWDRFSRLGRTRKKLRVWRRPKGRHSKTRERMKGYPASVRIGYGKDKEVRGKIQEKNPIMINNMKDLEKAKKDEIIIIGKMGKKKKIEIAKRAKEKNIAIYNPGINKVLKHHKKQEAKKQETKGEKK